MERTADKRIHTTEWEDAQYKYGNRIGKYATHELEILAQRVGDKTEDAALKAYDPNTEKVEDKMERGGYEMDGENVLDSDDDDDALAEIRKRRIQELKSMTEKQKFGVLRRIAGSEYVSEITEASAHSWVVAILVKPADDDCETMLKVMQTVAQKHREVKFVSIISTDAIPNFPNHHLPCVLLYRNKELVKQMTTLDPWKSGRTFDVSTVERVLGSNGVIAAESDED